MLDNAVMMVDAFSLPEAFSKITCNPVKVLLDFIIALLGRAARTDGIIKTNVLI